MTVIKMIVGSKIHALHEIIFNLNNTIPNYKSIFLKKFMVKLASLIVFTCLFSASVAAFQPPKSPESTVFGYQAYMLSKMWKDFARFPPSVESNDFGFVGINREIMSYPELQASGSAFVIRGIIQEKPEWKEKGWRILDAAFVGMSSEGRLLGTKDVVHSSAFFLSGYSEALLADSSSATPVRVRQFITAVTYLTQERQQGEGRAMCERFTHRCFLWALMYKGADALGPDRDFAKVAKEFINKGLRYQKIGGVLPENGSFDALYQSIANDALIKLTAIELDPGLRNQLMQAARASLNMMAARVAENGRFDTSGSVRMTREKMRDGQAKRISNWQVAFPFVGAAILFQEPLYRSIAQRVMRCNAACQNEN